MVLIKKAILFNITEHNISSCYCSKVLSQKRTKNDKITQVFATVADVISCE